MTSIRPKQRISISEKMKPEYYKNNMSYYIGIATSSNDKRDVISNIEAANGIVPADVYKYVLKPLKGDGVTKLPGDIRDTDFITPIREKNIGEYISLPNDFTVKVSDPDVIMLRHKEVADKIAPIIDQEIVNTINKEQDTGVPSTEPVDIKKIIEEKTKEWFDERANNALMLVKDINSDNDFNTKVVEAYSNWWSTEHVYFYIYSQNGGVFYDVISPLEGYTVSNGYEFVQDHEAFIIKRELTIDRINETYKDKLDSKDREYIEHLLSNITPDGTYSISSEMYSSIYGKTFVDSNINNGSINTIDGQGRLIFSTSPTIAERILFYKTEVERKILIYYNELGEVKDRVIQDDEDFEFNEELGHISIEKEWITETWKQVLLGNEDSGIYIKPEPLDVQTYDERGANKLPIIGKKGILNGTFINPIPKRIIPNLALHRIITLQIERLMARFKGDIEIIPQSMLGKLDADVKANYFYRMADGTIIYDDSIVGPNVANTYRIIGNDSVSNYIKVLIDLRNDIKNEAWDMANMNDARYGNAAPSATVTNNQQNIFNAKLGSVLGITIFNSVLVKLYETILTYAEHTYIEGKSGTMFNPDGTISYYNIDSDTLTANKFGIYMTNSVIDAEKLKEYKQFAFSAGQHGEFQLATAALEGESVSGIRTKLDTYIKAKDEFEKKLKLNEQAIKKQIHDEVMADKKADRDAKAKNIVLKEDMTTEREVKLEGIKNSNLTNK